MRAQGAAPEGLLAGTSGGRINTGNGILSTPDAGAQATAQTGEIVQSCTNHRRAGRPALDEKTATVNALIPEWSPRTRATYLKAWRQIEFAGGDIAALIRQFTRPNGSMNVSGLARRAEDMAAWKIALQEAGR